MSKSYLELHVVVLFTCLLGIIILAGSLILLTIYDVGINQNITNITIKPISVNNNGESFPSVIDECQNVYYIENSKATSKLEYSVVKNVPANIGIRHGIITGDKVVSAEPILTTELPTSCARRS